MPWLAKSTLLSLDELTTICRVAVEAGITEIRLTGGEPLLRRTWSRWLRRWRRWSPQGRPEVSITTNGIGLARLAQPLADAGLARVNVSLDTLQRERYVRLARRDRLVDTLADIDAAIAAGLQPVKLNSVLMRGVNDDEAVDLVRWSLGKGVEMRFIEQMPLDAGHQWTREQMVTADEVQTALERAFTLTPVPGRGAAPAERFLIDGGPASVGIIASVTRPFCGNCDRLRLTADSQLRSCLFATAEITFGRRCAPARRAST